MKTSFKSISLQVSVFLFMLLAGITAFAQDNTTQTTVTHTSSATTDNGQAMWYMQPWVWVAAGAAVLLLIILMARGNNSDRQEVTRTTKVTTEVKNS